jgi:hypothetical protein
MLTQIFGAHRSLQASSQSEVESVSYEEMLRQAPTVRELLRRHGATPDQEYDDFQRYIADAERRLLTELVHDINVPLAGNVHISLGRVVSRKEADDAFADDSQWKEPKVAP